MSGENNAAEPVFLLVAGSCLGAWCWRDVITALEARGHTARAIDLPAQGTDETPCAQVTLDMYRDAILADIDAHGGAPVVLVGHSAAGFPITAVAEAAPQKVRRLVYVCAYVPRAGRSLVDMRRGAREQPILGYIKKTPDGVAYEFRADAVQTAMFHDCPDGTAAYALARLRPQPITPQATPLDFGTNAASVPRSYILCANDRTIPPPEQAAMTEDWPAGTVHTLDCGHAPFFAAPDALAALLLEKS